MCLFDCTGVSSEQVTLRHPVMPVANRPRQWIRRDQWRPVGKEGRPSYARAKGSARACRRSRRLPAPYAALRQCRPCEAARRLWERRTWPGRAIRFSHRDSNTSSSLALPARRRPRWLGCGCGPIGSGLSPVFSRLCCQNATHRCAPDSETPGDFGFGNTGTIQLPNLGGLKARSHRPAELFTVLPG